MTEVCYDEMGASAPLGMKEGMTDQVPSISQEERRRWAFGQAMGFATMKRSQPTLSEVESWTYRFAKYAETGSFGAPA